MHNPKATAHALASVGAILYALCALWVVAAPASFLSVMTLWAHTVDLQALPMKTPGFLGLLSGLVTFTAVTWLIGYFFARFYNYFSKRS